MMQMFSFLFKGEHCINASKLLFLLEKYSAIQLMFEFAHLALHNPGLPDGSFSNQ
jgi:hypothetical protein